VTPVLPPGEHSVVPQLGLLLPRIRIPGSGAPGGDRPDAVVEVGAAFVADHGVAWACGIESSKPDAYTLTSGVGEARPDLAVQPAGIGGIRSNDMWSPVDSCSNAARARRAEAFAPRRLDGGADDGGFCTEKGG
jgi:hypothetical protein